MRIIAGEYKGKLISKSIPSGIRPTTDKVRESLFNILTNHIDFKEKIVADICAGTGFLGFEALSRGAQLCYFFEKNRKVIEFIKKSAKDLGISKDNYKIIPGDALKTINKFSEKNSDPEFHIQNINNIHFDIIFFDPPYNSGLFNPVIDAVTNSSLIRTGTIFIIEYPNKLKLVLPEICKILSERTYSTTSITITEFK
jgi:16S rRNA (guanine966-N2)-methyltransferase